MPTARPTRIICCQCGNPNSIWPAKKYEWRHLHWVPALNDYAHLSCLAWEILNHEALTEMDMNPLRVILGLKEPAQ